MLNIIQNKRKLIENIAKETALKVSNMFEFSNEEDLTLNYYLFSKEFVDSFDFEMACILCKKKSQLKKSENNS